MRRRGFAALCLLLAAGFAALGIWQVERRAWKHALIERVEARVRAAPAPLPPRAAWREDQSYRRVRVIGRFLRDRDTLVQAVTVRGPGWWVVTPLRTGETTLLVNRGFVPTDRRSPPVDTDPVAVTGLLRASEPGGAFLRSNDATRDRWYSRDVAAIARARGIGDTPPFFLDAEATPDRGGLPVGGLTVIRFADNHLVYALTWFALAGMAAWGAVLAWRGRKAA